MRTTTPPVKETRHHFGLSQEQLARVLGTSWVSVSRWERGISNPPPDADEKLHRLAELHRHLDGLISPADLPKFLMTLIRPCGYSFLKLIELVEKTKAGEFS